MTDIMKQILEDLESLFEEAESKGLWFYSSYQSLAFSPKELRKRHAEGKFVWGVTNWQLIDPQVLIEQKRKAIANAQIEYKELKGQVEGVTDVTKIQDAIEGSIMKWDEIVDGTGIDEGMDNCPLCKLFYTVRGCGDCPVAELSGVSGCGNTPYETWRDHQIRVHKASLSARWVAVVHDGCPECKTLAENELQFLRGLT